MVTMVPLMNWAADELGRWGDGALDKSRLEAFSDGVIAIIITIMVLELKAPHGADLGALVRLSGISCLGGHAGWKGAQPCRDAKSLIFLMPSWTSFWLGPPKTAFDPNGLLDDLKKALA